MHHTVKNDDLAARLLLLLCEHMPDTLRPWGQALLAELGAIDGFWRRLQWSVGGATALVRAWLWHGFEHKVGEEHKRLDVSLVASYHFLFSATLIGVVTWQLPQITEPWKFALPVLIICYALALLPAILGLGLVLRDEAARIGTIVFTIAHLLLNTEYLRRGGPPHARLTLARLAADLLIVFVLTRQPVRLHFRLSPLALHLNDGSPVSPGNRASLQ